MSPTIVVSLSTKFDAIHDQKQFFAGQFLHGNCTPWNTGARGIGTLEVEWLWMLSNRTFLVFWSNVWRTRRFREM